MKEIGIYGLDLNSNNKGCEALAYAFLTILNEIAVQRKIVLNILYLQKLPTKKILKDGFNTKNIMDYFKPKYKYKNLNIDILLLFHSHSRTFYNKRISKLDYVIDFTGGDSFSDIYGMKRFWDRTIFKANIIKHGVPLILGSQTIGPFNSQKARTFAAKVINDCHAVFVRDKMSYDYTLKISGRRPCLTTDVAFALPYQKAQLKVTNKIRVGFNPSGLLWYGGYTGDNQFGLTVDYKKYCENVIEMLLKDGRYEVHLILHAFENNTINISDNDYVPIKELHAKFPDTIISPLFDSCIDAKGYIASMDVLIGARMHATIGAFSAFIPVIAFAYSRKFEGLFSSLNYPYVLNARELTTERAVNLSLEWIEKRDELRELIIKGHALVDQKMEVFKRELSRIIFEN